MDTITYDISQVCVVTGKITYDISQVCVVTGKITYDISQVCVVTGKITYDISQVCVVTGKSSLEYNDINARLRGPRFMRKLATSFSQLILFVKINLSIEEE